MKLTPGDKAQSEALRIAEDWLKKQGWKFTPADVGTRAREILNAMAPTGRRALAEQEGRDDE